MFCIENQTETIKKRKPNKKPNGYLCTANWASLLCKEDLKMLLSFQAGVKDALGSTALGCRTIPGSRPTAETSEMKKLTAQNVEKKPQRASKRGLFRPQRASPPRPGSCCKMNPRHREFRGDELRCLGTNLPVPGGKLSETL